MDFWNAKRVYAMAWPHIIKKGLVSRTRLVGRATNTVDLISWSKLPDVGAGDTSHSRYAAETDLLLEPQGGGLSGLSPGV